MEEKGQAEAEYQTGLQEQKTSILLTEETADILQIRLGHLPPGAGARVSGVFYLKSSFACVTRPLRPSAA